MFFISKLDKLAPATTQLCNAITINELLKNLSTSKNLREEPYKTTQDINSTKNITWTPLTFPTITLGEMEGRETF